MSNVPADSASPEPATPATALPADTTPPQPDRRRFAVGGLTRPLMRGAFDPAKLADLKTCMATRGLQEDIHVAAFEDAVASGNMRVEAAVQLGWEYIDGLYHPELDTLAKVRAFALASDVKSDRFRLDAAAQYKALKAELNIETDAALAAAVGVSPATLCRYFQVYDKFPREIHALMEAGALRLKVVLAARAVKDEGPRLDLLRQAAAGRWTEAVFKSHLPKAARPKTGAGSRPLIRALNGVALHYPPDLGSDDVRAAVLALVQQVEAEARAVKPTEMPLGAVQTAAERKRGQAAGGGKGGAA